MQQPLRSWNLILSGAALVRINLMNNEYNLIQARSGVHEWSLPMKKK